MNPFRPDKHTNHHATNTNVIVTDLCQGTVTYEMLWVAPSNCSNDVILTLSFFPLPHVYSCS